MGMPFEGDVGFADVSAALVFDRSNASSITGAWFAARENARRARETLSTELWEGINTTWHRWHGFGRDHRHRAAPVVGARAGRAGQRHRRLDDVARRGLGLPRARPQPRARRHDRPAGRHRRAAARRGRRGRSCCRAAVRNRRSCAASAACSATTGPPPSSSSTASSPARCSSRCPRPSAGSTPSPRSRTGSASPTRPAASWAASAPRSSSGPPPTSSPTCPRRCSGVQGAVTAASQAIAKRYFQSGPLQTWTKDGVF